MKSLVRSLLSVLLLLCFLTSFSEAQTWKSKRFETVFGAGSSQFFGDIGGFSKGSNAGGLRDMSIPQLRFDVNINLKYRITQNFNARISLTYGYLHASDARGSNRDRGFEASSSLFEPAILGEYYFFRNKAEDNLLFTGDGKRTSCRFFQSLSFYAFTGIGGLNFSVKGNNNLVNAGMKRGGFTAVIPAGLGSTLGFSPNLNFGFEFSGRYAFSDYLEGYSSIYSKSNDVYFFLNLTVTYKLNIGPNCITAQE